MTPAPLLTLAEVAVLFRVGHTTLRKMRRDPAFPNPIRTSQRPLKWRRVEIENYLETQ